MQVSEGRVVNMEKEANGTLQANVRKETGGMSAEATQRLTQWAELGSGVVSGRLSPQVFPVFIQGETY